MPGSVKTPAQEKAWKRAKEIVSEQRSKGEASFTDKDWGLVNHIYHNMVESSLVAAAQSSAQDVHVLLAQVQYMLTRRRKKVRADKNEDLPETAKDLVEALSAVMAVGGQTIAALRKSKGEVVNEKESAALSGELHSLAEKLTKLLDTLR
jgi:hypothetical protein